MQTDASVDSAKYILIAVMVFVAYAALYLSYQLNGKIRPITEQLVQQHTDRGKSIGPDLMRIESKYKDLFDHVDNIDASEFGAGEIETLCIRAWGRLVTVADVDSFIKQAPGILISLGLLGTFWGLTVGLDKISGALSPGATPQQTMAALSAIVAPMGTAFQTSLIGLLFSLVVLIVTQISGSRTCLEQCESLLSSWLETVLPRKLKGKLMSPLKKSIDELNKTVSCLPLGMKNSIERAMKEAFAAKLADMFNVSSSIAQEAQQATRQLSAVALTMNECGQDFVMAARSFQQSDFPAALRESVAGLLEAKQRMMISSDHLGARMLEVRDSLLALQAQWQSLAKSAETELETCRLAAQQAHQGLQQLQASSQTLEEGVQVAAVATKQLTQTSLDLVRDRELSIEVAQSVRQRLAVDTSSVETCQVFASALETSLRQWNSNVEQLDELRRQFIEYAISDRADDQTRIQGMMNGLMALIEQIHSSLVVDVNGAVSAQLDALGQLSQPMNNAHDLSHGLTQQLSMLKDKVAQDTQSLAGSIKSRLDTDLGHAIDVQREALGQLADPITKAQQLSVELIQQLEALRVRMEQQTADVKKRGFWGLGGGA